MPERGRDLLSDYLPEALVLRQIGPGLNAGPEGRQDQRGYTEPVTCDCPRHTGSLGLADLRMAARRNSLPGRWPSAARVGCGRSHPSPVRADAIWRLPMLRRWSVRCRDVCMVARCGGAVLARNVLPGVLHNPRHLSWRRGRLRLPAGVGHERAMRPVRTDSASASERIGEDPGFGED